MKNVLSTGSSIGIGFEAARQLGNRGIEVLITARKEEDKTQSEKKLRMIRSKLHLIS